MSMYQCIYHTCVYSIYNAGVCVVRVSIYIYRDPDAVIQTSTNEAYGVTKTALSEEGTYEYVCIRVHYTMHGYNRL